MDIANTAASHMLEDRRHGDLGRVDNRIDAKGSDERNEPGNIDQRHGVRRSVSLGQQRRENVHLIIISNRDKCFSRTDISFRQNVAVESIAVENARLTQIFGKEMSARGVSFDQIDLCILEIGLDLGCQHLADGTATGDKY